jgi:hypothetical protein
MLWRPEKGTPFKADGTGLSIDTKSALTLESFVGLFAKPAPTWEATAQDNMFKFRLHRDIVDCTAFLVGDHVIATAAHCVFGVPSANIKAKTLRDWLFVFCVTTDHVEADNAAAIPADKIYEIDRLVFLA